MSKTKILYVITKSDVGGAQKYVADLADGLDKNQFEAKILYGGRDLNPHTKRGLVPSAQNNSDPRYGMGVKWLSNKIWPWAFFLNDWLAILELIKIYKKERPNIIHLNSSKTGILGSLAAKIYTLLNPKSYILNPKVIFTAHGWVFNPTNKLSFLIRWFYILLHKWTAFFQDKIICVSEYDCQLALKYKIAPEKKLITIHNGIDPNIQFLDKQTARQELIKKLEIGNWKLEIDKQWIGSIGRLVKEKNYETFIRAAALVPKANFFIIGSGPEYYKLKAKSLKLKANVFLIEPTGQDHKYLKAFDIFVMTSIKEGCPYILLEAMAAGLPAVITRAGGMPEIIQDQKNGLVVEQKNPEMLAGAIQKLFSNKNKANELGRAAQKTIREQFELKKMAAQTTNVYKSLVIRQLAD